jgi:hypothetical protein
MGYDVLLLADSLALGGYKISGRKLPGEEVILPVGPCFNYERSGRDLFE